MIIKSMLLAFFVFLVLFLVFIGIKSNIKRKKADLLLLVNAQKGMYWNRARIEKSGLSKSMQITKRPPMPPLTGIAVVDNLRFLYDAQYNSFFRNSSDTHSFEINFWDENVRNESVNVIGEILSENLTTGKIVHAYMIGELMIFPITINVIQIRGYKSSLGNKDTLDTNSNNQLNSFRPNDFSVNQMNNNNMVCSAKITLGENNIIRWVTFGDEGCNLPKECELLKI